MPLNLALTSIPAYYLLSLAPRFYAFNLIRRSKFPWDGTNPQSTTQLEALQKTLDTRTYTAIERSTAAHRNNMEQMPIYVAAVLAGLMAEGRAGKGCTKLGLFVCCWMMLRTIYTLLYIRTEQKARAWIRGLVWMLGGFAAIWEIVAAARVLDA